MHHTEIYSEHTLTFLHVPNSASSDDLGVLYAVLQALDRHSGFCILSCRSRLLIVIVVGFNQSLDISPQRFRFSDLLSRYSQRLSWQPQEPYTAMICLEQIYLPPCTCSHPRTTFLGTHFPSCHPPSPTTAGTPSRIPHRMHPSTALRQNLWSASTSIMMDQIEAADFTSFTTPPP